MGTIKTTLTRDNYGCLWIGNASEADRAIYQAASAIVATAAKSKKIPAAYDGISRDRKGRFDGDAVHHEIYDIAPNGKSVLVCVRGAEGSKYGVRTTYKSYFLVTVCGKGVKVAPANKAVAAKAAKACGAVLGGATAVVAGKTKLPVPALKIRTGYKMVRRDADGNLISVWDKSPWPIGKMRIEAATNNHRGGFYHYATPEEAIEAAQKNEIFGTARGHHDLVLVECEISGKEFLIGNAKRCSTRIKPVREIASML